MRHLLPFYIGLRYTWAKRRNHFISFISLISMLGIALGVTVLITVLSVMNGFDKEIRQRLFAVAPQVTVSATDGSLSNWSALAKRLLKIDKITTAAPFITTQGLLTYKKLSQPVFFNGIVPKDELQISQLSEKFIDGKLGDLKPGSFRIAVGEELANNMGVDIGDKLTLMVPKTTVTLTGVVPRYKRFTIAGIFKTDTGFGFDRQFIFMNLKDAQRLMQMGSKVTGVRLKLTDLYLAPDVSKYLASVLPPSFFISDWTFRFGALFKAIKLEKNMMFLILLLIIAVAVFNLVSTLVMMVADKRADIAVLRTLGARSRTIMQIFMMQGAIVGLVGTGLGVIGGIVLSNNVTAWSERLQQLLGTRFLSSKVYFVDFLPSELLWSDVWQIVIAAIVMCLLATIYPAWRATRVRPAEALRYE